MTAQLALDFDLPVEAGTVTQVAVVFTALGGPHKGQRVYETGDSPIFSEAERLEWLRWYLAEWVPAEADGRLMVRTVTCSEWEPL